jgi:hypothetical protein
VKERRKERERERERERESEPDLKGGSVSDFPPKFLSGKLSVGHFFKVKSFQTEHKEL